MISFPNAKINLGLNITSKRPDGFHNIESVFYPIPWSDILEVIPSDEFEFSTSGLAIPGYSKNNLVIKAYELLKKEGYLSNTEAKIHLHKILPMGAGIGGGSSNGAFTLKLLNDVFELNISVSQLQNYAAQLGSDCAFFIENKPMFCFGKGNEFKEIDLDLTGKVFVLINPQIHISTAEAYSGVVPSKPKLSILEIIKTPISEWKENLVNDFEVGIKDKYPALAKIKTKLYEMGALYSSMTGSGSTVFGIFDTQVDLQFFREKDYMVWEG